MDLQKLQADIVLAEGARKEAYKDSARREARLAGEMFYQGSNCKRNHNAKRYTSNGTCVECLSLVMSTPEFKQRDLLRKRKRRGMPEATRPRPYACECCGRSTFARALSLDHDHRTGAFRGWLCGCCNTAIGRLGDTVEGVEKALKYLKRAQQ